MFKKLMKRFKRDNKGQGMVEYGLILALISVVAIGALSGIGDSVNDKFSKVNDAMRNPSEVALDQLINDGYIPIATADELDKFRVSKMQTFGEGTPWVGEYVSGLDKNYIQVSDINMVDIGEFDTIAPDHPNAFTGTYDGGGYKISNLIVDNSDIYGRYTGLFGYSQGGTLKNINLKNVTVIGGDFTGGLLGFQQGSANVINCYVTGKVTGGRDNGTGSSVGGLVGWQNGGSTIKNSLSKIQVVGVHEVGGLAGRSSSSNVINSYATGKVSGITVLGGLIGKNDRSKIESSGWAKDVNVDLDGVGTIMNEPHTPVADIEGLLELDIYERFNSFTE